MYTTNRSALRRFDLSLGIGPAARATRPARPRTTADVLCTQTDHAEQITTRGAHVLAPVRVKTCSAMPTVNLNLPIRPAAPMQGRNPPDHYCRAVETHRLAVSGWPAIAAA
ncbi:hypothetical protein [Streptomyces malaysiensis]|uniref:hypothetical protein n=1 Tax=Streptomyces malaysiensis TaxID=92644 RepID=UPI00371F3906